MGGLQSDFRVRRVDFRAGTEADLTALHAVESVVQAERRPDRVPQPLEAYISFARSLPSQFEDHTWLVDTDSGVPVATAACWSNNAGDGRMMGCDVVVLGPHRRRGIGSHLLGVVADVAEAEGRPLTVWSTFDTVPAGEAFARLLGARVARVNRRSESRLADIDWEMVSAWAADGPRRAPGYSIEMLEGPYPADRRDDAVTFEHIMQTAPREDLDAGDVVLDVDDIVEQDRHLVESGVLRWSLFVRDPSGACVGGTDVLFEPWEPSTVLQQNTGIDPRHRGRGLAKWAKAAMLERIRAERPAAVRVTTGNAFSNGPMLAINDALGFTTISTRTEWQIETGSLRRALA